ncbi:MAG: hypothetical protein HY698_14620 [Deltaproteobacteria bacterium]|nr:hypothetical protein [Deltaproteobacteria bacterium]
MTIDRPNYRYYRANHGRWRGALALAITDWRAFFACRMSVLDRLRAISMSLVPKLLGPLCMETSVDYHASAERDGEVRHTTRVSKWGLTLFRGEEILVLAENGRDVALRGVQRHFPTPWIVRGLGDACASVDEPGTRARYELEFLGAPLHQTGEIVAGGVRITQETEFSRAVVLLRRIEP